jgi:chaperonin GroEL
VALLLAKKSLESLKLKGDEAVGVSIVERALSAPLKRIAQNAGIDGAIAVQKVSESSAGIGLDARSLEYTDLVKAGIIDPTKVVRCALQNAASIATLLLTTDAIISEIPEEKPAAAMPGGPPGY